MAAKKLTFSKRIHSLKELDQYLSEKKSLHNYSLISYIWHEYGFFPIYFNELFNEFFTDCNDEPIIGTCFPGHEFFYEGKVDELLILDGFINTSRAYKNSKETPLLLEKFKKHANQSIAFWFVTRNFDEDAYQSIIDKYQFKRELFSIGKKKTWYYHLHPGPRESRPYQYARGHGGKKYWLPENITPWQTHKRLGWNLKNWTPIHHHPRIIQGDYSAIFVKNSFKTLDTDGKKRFGYIDNEFLQKIIEYYISKRKKLIVIHDLVEYEIPQNEFIQQVRMSHYFDVKFYLSIVHHSSVFISSATSPIDLAAYYCNTHLVLLDDKGNKLDWVKKVSEMRGKECIASDSRTNKDASKVIQFLENIDKKTPLNTKTNRKLNIGGTQAVSGWEILNGRADEYVDHVGEASDLSRFNDQTFDIIYSSHTLEHISYWNDLIQTLQEWKRALKDDGEILISVPNLDVLCEEFSHEKTTKKQRYSIMRIMYGGQYHEYDYHYAGFNLDIMNHFATHAGLTIVEQVEQFNIFPDTSSSRLNGKLISLNVILKKAKES